MKGISLRRYVAKARQHYAKVTGCKNGVLPQSWFDFGSKSPETEKRARERKPNKSEILKDLER